MKHSYAHFSYRYFSALLLWLVTFSAWAASNNILIIIADDLGTDMLGVYGRSADTPPTPNIDALKANGVMFRNAWSNPFCSPTRATIQTGQYGFRTGVGFVSEPSFPGSAVNGLPLSDPSIRPIPRVLSQFPGLGYSHAAIGKWHLSNTESSLSDPITGVKRKVNAPNDAGWSYFSGNWSFMGGTDVTGGSDDYFTWQKLENGTTTTIGSLQNHDPRAYVTTINVDDAIRWVGQQNGPWLLYLAFNSPHSPFHAPPPALLNPPRSNLIEDPAKPNYSARTLYKAMIEAMDSEIGRLTRALGPALMAKTTVIFLGDNGTPRETVVAFPPAHAKGTLYEGGVNVPLIISGADVKKPNRESQALVNTTDLYATVLDLAGVDLRTASAGIKLDATSLRPILNNTYNRSLRKYIYAELFNQLSAPNYWTRAIRNDRFKLIRFISDKNNLGAYTEELYELALDPFEQVNLLSNSNLTPVQQKNWNDLRAQLDLHVQFGTSAAGTEKWIAPYNSWFRNILDSLLD